MNCKPSKPENASSIAVVILAAGESKRYGSPKQLANWFDEPLLMAAIRQVEYCGYTPYVVIGAHKEQIHKDKCFAPYIERFITVDKWQRGISASIIASIEFLQAEPVHGVLFILGDQPLIGEQHIQQMLSLAEARPEEMLCTAYNVEHSEFGVPAYFPRISFEKLLKLQADQGAKWLLRSSQPIVVAIEAGMPLEDSLLDIDEPEDLARARSIFSSSVQAVNK